MLFFQTTEEKFKCLYNKYNSATMHPYKINIMSFKSPDVTKKIRNANSLESISQIQSLLCNENLLEKVYEKWNPSVVFISLSEIYLIKMYEEDDDYTLLYGGNIHKVLTTLSSTISLATGFEFSGSFIELDRDEDLLEFVALKQKEIYRNSLNFLWDGDRGFTPSIKTLQETGKEVNVENLKYGVFIKTGTQFYKSGTDVCILGPSDSNGKWIHYTFDTCGITLDQFV
jgi:hypothetical protein